MKDLIIGLFIAFKNDEVSEPTQGKVYAKILAESDLNVIDFYLVRSGELVYLVNPIDIITIYD